MQIITDIKEMKSLSDYMRLRGGLIGFVPTMGALHEGHVSLIRQARVDNGCVVISIFVNPIQFDRKDDLLAYPRDLEKDHEIALKNGADIIFEPEVSAIYPNGYCTYVIHDRLTDVLCGAYRPGHFKGVATIVAKLFNIVRPQKAYFGQKDFQQTVVIKKMVNDLNMDVEIIVMPTVRDPDGLALSSRNSRLSDDERQDALCLYEAINKARSLFASGIIEPDRLISDITDIINSRRNVSIEYVSIVDPDTLEDVSIINGRALLSLAVWIGNTRLIDNCLLST